MKMFFLSINFCRQYWYSNFSTQPFYITSLSLALWAQKSQHYTFKLGTIDTKLLSEKFQYPSRFRIVRIMNKVSLKFCISWIPLQELNIFHKFLHIVSSLNELNSFEVFYDHNGFQAFRFLERTINRTRKGLLVIASFLTVFHSMLFHCCNMVTDGSMSRSSTDAAFVVLTGVAMDTH